mmetsp:Transcript_24550/g.40927  ORF Transcript_24550/g.40927 Transcript_24550/m.40927 type:complete len:94 (-) Transcript_24550:228-509(-)
MMERRAVLRLYKDILYHARRFPSVKRMKVVEEIRQGFRANIKLTNEVEQKKCLEVALDGLNKLSMYNGLSKKDHSWSVSMDSLPMPKDDGKQS